MRRTIFLDILLPPLLSAGKSQEKNYTGNNLTDPWPAASLTSTHQMRLFVQQGLLWAVAQAATHELIVGTFKTNALYTLRFDDSTLSLQLVDKFTTPFASSWIALSHDKKNVYGTAYNAAKPSFVSYAVGQKASGVAHSTTVPAGGSCTGKAIFVVSSPYPPYNVYGSFFGGSAGCGAVMTVDASGALQKTIQNFTYTSASGVHGMALGPNGTFLYSADDNGNSLWTHSISPTTGQVTYVANLTGPSARSDPRHVAVHPGGKWLYVVLEGSNQIAQYAISGSGIPSFKSPSYPLVPPSKDGSSYWSDEVALSASGSMLWATSRSRTSTPGYISAFTLDEQGMITKQNFLTATSTSGGSANAVTPSAFSDEYVALTDSSVGFVEIWKLAGDKSNASVVAHLAMADGGCCANAVWYS